MSLFILFLAKYKTRASIYLGLLILFITLTILQEYLWETEIINGLQYFLIYVPYPSATAGLLYFFVMTFLYPERKSKATEKALFLPFYLIFFVFLIYKLCHLFIDQTHSFVIQLNLILNTIERYGDLLNVTMIIVVLVLLWIAIKRYQNERAIYDSSILKSGLKWLKTLLVLQFAFILFWLYAAIYAAIMGHYNEHADSLLIATSILIYIMGYIGTQKIGLQEERISIRQRNFPKKQHSISKAVKNRHIMELEKILIDENRFLDPTISLDKLALELNLSTSHLSRLINTELKMSFSDYMNSLRVSEAKKLLLNPEFSNYTLVAIGLESGFNSKTTFNTVFKKCTSVTPSQFRKNPTN